MARGKKHWNYSTGERGRNRVRAYEDAKTGTLHLEFYEDVPGRSKPNRKALSLGHPDREKAKQRADELAAKFASAEPTLSHQGTLRELFDIYGREVTPQKGERQRKHDKRCAEMFLRFFGRKRKAHRTRLERFQQPEEETMRKAVESRRRGDRATPGRIASTNREHGRSRAGRLPVVGCRSLR